LPHFDACINAVIREGLPSVSFWPWQVVTSLFDLSCNTFPAVGLAVLESLFELKMLDGENRKFREMGHRLRNVLHKMLAPTYGTAEDDFAPGARAVLKERIILMPSLPTAAPLHGESLLRVLDTANTGFFNIMELPATAVPLGLEKSHRGSRMHMPVGCQVGEDFASGTWSV
jgi:Asp-tRNA(Asn)/Glu-tRNA(Gln) amidotransferase A subunit family amidase